MRVAHRHTALAILTNLVFIGLALAGLSSLALAIFADVCVTVLVILNSLRLLKFETTEERRTTTRQAERGL